ncbi:MAG: hypothetical protein EBZ47_03550 [Chlamydiae bacterium]|nr:hypothetical protein [Chlamydiota bacterium]
MNEILFLTHTVIILLCTLGAYQLGKEALMAWTLFQAIFANLFVLKQIEWLGLQITCSDVFAVGGILGLNLIQEKYGITEAKKLARLSLYSMVFFAVMSKIHLWYVPSTFDQTHSAYCTILCAAPRILMASLTSFFLTQQIDMRLFQTMKDRFPRLSLAARNTVSIILTQLLDTLLFSFLGLYGLMENLWHVIWVSFLVKIMVVFLLVPASALIVKRLSSPFNEAS